MLGFIIGRMVLSRSVIERAVRQQLADLDLDSGDFDVAAIVEAFEASVDDERDIQVDDGGGQGDPFAVNTRVGQVIAYEWGSERLAQLRIGVHLNRHHRLPADDAGRHHRAGDHGTAESTGLGHHRAVDKR